MFVAVLCASISASAYDFKVDEIAYTITSFSDLTCSVAASDVPYEGVIVIPSNVIFKGKTLTVTSISNSAFKNSNVTSVQIPVTVVKIEKNAFADCGNLNTVVFNEGLQTIGSNAFKGCVKLSNVDFPSSLQTIESAAFANCKSLSQVVLTDGITDCGESAFVNCENVLKVYLGNISKLNANTFNGCRSLRDIEWSNGLQLIGDYAFANCGFITFMIPNTVSEIGTKILFGNNSLQSFTIGNGISEITSDPIEKCPNVKDFIIADGDDSLILDFAKGGYSFVEREESRSSSDNWKYKSYYIRPAAYESSAFENVYIGRYLRGKYREQGSEDVRYYYSQPPFYGNKNIKSVKIGPLVDWLICEKFSTRFNSYAYGYFERCSNLETLEILGLEYIPDQFAKNASSLKSVEIANATKHIYSNAFSGCSSLETIILGPHISAIWSGSFDGCNALTSIYCKSNTPPAYSSTGFNKDLYLNCQLYIPLETEQVYKNASPWNNFWNMQESQECVSEFKKDDLVYTVTGENDVIVSGNTIMETRDLTIPSHVEYYAKDYNVTGIGVNAFKDALNLHSIVIPGCILKVDDDAFSGCYGLKNVTIDYSEKSIIFGHDSDLHKSTTLSVSSEYGRTDFVNGFYDGLFYGLPIEHLVINRNIELPKYYERRTAKYSTRYTVYTDIIYYSPFYGLKSLKSVEIGEKVSVICKNQIEAVVKAVPTTMDYKNFGRCDNIEFVVSNSPKAPIGGGFSDTAYANAKLFLPNGGLDSYKTDDYWKNFAYTSETFIPIESISFDSDNMTIGLNDSKVLQPIINPSDASIKVLRWSSSKPSIVNVSEDGIISTSSQEGEAIITATACDGTNVSASIVVIIKEDAGISDAHADGKLDILVEGGKLYFRGKADTDIISVFNVQGQLIISTNDNEIELGSKGVYIVKVNSDSKKVVI